MSGPFDEQRLADDLHRAAESYDPDTERIRLLLMERRAALRPERKTWTVAWVAAAASAVLAVIGAETVLSGSYRQQAPFGPAAVDRAGPTAASGSARLGPDGTATSVVPTGRGVATTAVSGSADMTSGGSPMTQASASVLPDLANSTRPVGGAPIVTAAPSTVPASGSTSSTVPATEPSLIDVGSGARHVVGDRSVTVDITSVGVGTRRTLGAAGEQWTAFAAAGSGVTAVEGPEAGWQVGPVQVLGNGATPDASPFALTWATSASGGSAGSSSTWLVVPHDTRTVPAGLRVPVRYGSRPVTLTLLAGAIDGGGQFTVNLQGTSLQADLPRCAGSGVCPAVVRIELKPVSGATASTGDLMVDLKATDQTAFVGVAAAILS